MLGIINLSLPPSCDDCCLNYDNYQCIITNSSTVFVDDNSRLKDCPLVNITKCKDCLFWHKEHNLCKGQDQYTCHTKADDYCSRGRRKHEQT